MSDSSLEIFVGVLNLVTTVAGVSEAEEVSAADLVAFAINILVVVGIPVSVSLGTFFTEAIALSFALLLNIEGAVFEVTLDGESSGIVSFSLAEGSVAFLASDVLSSVGDNSLHGYHSHSSG